MLRLVGDVSLTDGYFDVGFGVGSKIVEGFDPFHGIKRIDDDFWIGNFEGVAADCSDKNGNASRQFRIEPRYIKGLNHFDVYGFANNHAMQHGEMAYSQCTEALAGLGSIVIGGGKIDLRFSIIKTRRLPSSFSHSVSTLFPKIQVIGIILNTMKSMMKLRLCRMMRSR